MTESDCDIEIDCWVIIGQPQGNVVERILRQAAVDCLFQTIFLCFSFIVLDRVEESVFLWDFCLVTITTMA